MINSGKYKVNDDQRRVYENSFNFMTPGKGSVPGAWPYSENAIFLFSLLVYTGQGTDKLSILL